MSPSVRQRPRAGTRSRRPGLVVLSLGVAAVMAHSTHAYLLVDGCLDAGGRYLGEPPRCELPGRRVRPLGELPQRPDAWLLVLGPASLVGGAVYAVGLIALRRRPRLAG